MRSGAICFYLSVLTTLSCWMQVPAFAEDIVHVASDDWCPFVCAANGKLNGGYLVALTGEAMMLSGAHVEPVLMPLNRAMVQTAHGKIEAVYAPPIDDRLILSAPLGYSRACFYTLTDSEWRYQGIASLTAIRVGVIDDYGYDNAAMDDYIASNRQSAQRAFDIAYGESAGTDNLQKLLNARNVAILEHEAVMARLIAQWHADGKIRNAGCLANALPLTVGFARSNERSPDWIRRLDEGYQQLLANGRLKELQKRYNIPEAELAPVPIPTSVPAPRGEAHRVR